MDRSEQKSLGEFIRKNSTVGSYIFVKTWGYKQDIQLQNLNLIIKSQQ